jgi:3-methyl-2-oxobutanoate hydroxymethyltransferase
MQATPPELPADLPPRPPMTLKQLRRKAAAGEPISMLTCYDATTARWLAAAGLDCLLVGDSAANVILGHDKSIHAPLDLLIALTAAVKRGAPNCFVVGDMPFGSYQASDAEAVRNATRFLIEGHADAVKLEVDGAYGDTVAHLSRAGIPVIAHLGWRPQMGSYSGVRTAVVAGRTAAQVRELVDQAELMAARGAVMLLIEQCTPQAGEQIVKAVDIPVIGCGAGPACHGHVVVLQDLVGMSERHPSFVQPVAQIGEQIAAAGRSYVQQLQQPNDPADHPYQMDAGEADKLKR